MTVITPGVDSTLKSTTLESRILECASLISRSTLSSPNAIMNIAIDVAENTVRIDYRLATTHSISNGDIKLNVLEITNFSGFNPGIDGNFSSPGICASFIEMITLAQNLELIVLASNSNTNNNVTFDYNSDDSISSGYFASDIDLTILDNGNISITAVEFLPTLTA